MLHINVVYVPYFLAHERLHLSLWQSEVIIGANDVFVFGH